MNIKLIISRRYFTMNVIQEIERIKASEAKMGIFGGDKASWHDKYRNSAWVYIGGLPKELTEGDVICVMSQWGEIEDLNLVRDKETGKSMGFCFVKYEDQRSTILAVDNFNGVKLLGMTLRCDHVDRYKLPKHIREKEEAAIEEDPTREVQLGPGHAYSDKELANEYSIEKGINLWARPTTRPALKQLDLEVSAVAASKSTVGAAVDRTDVDTKSSHKKDRKEKKEHKHKKDRRDRDTSRSRSRDRGDGDRRRRHRSRSATRSRSRSRSRRGNKDTNRDRDRDRDREAHSDDRKRNHKRSRSYDRDRHRDGSSKRSRRDRSVDEATRSAAASVSRSSAAPSVSSVPLVVSGAPLPPPVAVVALPGNAGPANDTELAPVSSWRGRLDPSLTLPAPSGPPGRAAESFYGSSSSSFAGIKRSNIPPPAATQSGAGGSELPPKKSLFDSSFGGMARRR